MLQKAFNMFDSGKKGRIEKEKVRTILNTLGHSFNDHELEALLEDEDTDGKSKFEIYCTTLHRNTFILHFCSKSTFTLQIHVKMHNARFKVTNNIFFIEKVLQIHCLYRFRTFKFRLILSRGKSFSGK